MEEGKVLEGFFCPECYIDLKTAVQLNAHFQEHHSDEQDILKSVKDIFEKAKKKILSKEQENSVTESETSSVQIIKSTPGYNPSGVNAEPGACRSHSEYFKAVRTLRMERYASQTNNLLIRLQKLLTNLPSDPIKRKAHEQEVVPWLSDKDVKLCPGCAKPFGLLKRKHHCRLCGAVMCNECTSLLSLDSARKMVNTSIASSSSSDASQKSSSSKNSTPVKKLLKSPSSSSVQSVLTLDLTSENFFRLCEHCYKLLEIKQKLKEARSQKPIISQFYEKLRTGIDETIPLLATYTKMYNSLSVGETTYNLADAQTVRVKILRLAEVIDAMSRKIAVLGQNSESPPQGNQLLLQKTVRDAAAHYLKENIISLPSLPTEEQIRQVQEQRRQEMARKIEEERLAFEAQHSKRGNESESRPKSSHGLTGANSSTPSKDRKVHVEGGWTSDVFHPIVSDNPIIQQMNNIRLSIKKAKESNRLDVVETLEKNLAELNEELWRQNESKNSKDFMTEDANN